MNAPLPEVRAFWQHAAAAVAEGVCPYHGQPMTPVRHDATVIVGAWCPACRGWWSLDARQTVTKSVGAQPVYEDGKLARFSYAGPQWAI